MVHDWAHSRPCTRMLLRLEQSGSTLLQHCGSLHSLIPQPVWPPTQQAPAGQRTVMIELQSCSTEENAYGRIMSNLQPATFSGGINHYYYTHCWRLFLTAQPVPSILQTCLLVPCQHWNTVQPLEEQ